MKIVGKVYLCFVHQTPLFIGLSLGIALSLVLIPLMEDNCIFHEQQNSPITHEDYEPIINLQIRPVQRTKTRLVRPRYYSTELGIKEKLLIAIVVNSSSTSVPKLEKNLVAINRTLSAHADKLVYFVDSAGPPAGLPAVVGFDDPRPNLLPLHVLQYLNDNYLNEYDYYFVAEHTTFVVGAALRSYVDRLGVDREAYVGLRSGLEDAPWCSFEAGILLSNKVLRGVTDKLKWCVDNWTDDGDGFGKCVYHVLDLPCSDGVQGRRFYSYRINNFNDEIPWRSTNSIFSIEVHTLYPIESWIQHYQLNYYFSKKDVMTYKSNVRSIQKKMQEISSFFPDGNQSLSWPVDIESPFKPNSRFDVIQWTHFNDTHLFLPNELTTLSRISGIEKLDLEHVRNLCKNWLAGSCGKCTFERILQGYRKFDPTRGMEYIVDLIYKNEETGISTTKHLQIIRPLTKLEIIPIPFVTEHTRIILILIIKSSNQVEAIKFLENYSKSCLDKQDNTVLLLVFLYNPNEPGKGTKNDVFGSFKGLVNKYTTKYRATGAKIAWLSIKTAGRMPSEFSIYDLIVRKLQPETMVLQCQTNMEIHSEYLNRVRMNTIINHQVFFPIPFVQYHPKIVYKGSVPPEYIEVKKDYGHFDLNDYDHMSFYVQDYLAARKTIEDSVPIVQSDRDLLNGDANALHTIYKMFLRSKSVHVIRAIEPSLKVSFRLDECHRLPTSSTAHNGCILTKSLGTRSQLSALLLERERNESKNL
ncbi:chondroitin sulfate glucuronyltransferase [Centruroides vittatus]|uniref:chondroitin sulfate glucuronyltransferase n=1 Tax=Centruroides vittatus TaxID=120091 RepID=UPI00350F2D60